MFCHKRLSLNINNINILNEQLENLEQDIYLLGGTGLEDLLQDNVKKCIKDFKMADIKVWMLTGDKGETA